MLRLAATFEYQKAVHISTTFTTTPRMVLRSYVACHRAAFVARCLLSGLFVVLGLFQRDLILAALGVAVFVAGELPLRRQLRPYLSGPRDVTVTMTDDEYRVDGPDRHTSRSW